MRRPWMIVCLSLVALALAGCGDSISPVSDDASAKSAAVAQVGKTARDVARQTTGAVPQIVNPAEELVQFDPAGILRWSAVAGADAYEVWAYNDAGLSSLAEFSKALVSRQYQFTQLAGGKTYWIKLYFRANGVWQEAPTFSLQTTANVVKSRLTNSQEELEAFGPSGTLRWTAVAGADVYELWIYRDAARVAFAETSGPVRITQYQITSLTPGTAYYVQVYARVNGQYTAGGALQLTVTGQLNRARILNPQEELDAFATNGLLRWSPVTGATAYELWIFTNPNSSEIHESSGSLTARSYQTRTMQPGKVYYAQAYALVNGQWQVGAPVKITTTTTPTKARLTTPQEQLEAFATNGTLRWTEVPGATAYELWIYSNAGLGKIVESGANPDRSYTTRRLCSGAVYYVQVHALVNGQWTVGWATRLDVTQGTSAADCIPPSPTVKLTPSSPQVERGQNVTLTWTTQFATTCTASDGWSGAKNTNGQQTVGPLDKNTLFTLTCVGPSGQYLAQTIVTLVPPPTRTTVGRVYRRDPDVAYPAVYAPTSGVGAADVSLLGTAVRADSTGAFSINSAAYDGNEYSPLTATASGYSRTWLPWTTANTAQSMPVALYDDAPATPRPGFSFGMILHDIGGFTERVYAAGLYPPTFDRVRNVAGANVVTLVDTIWVNQLDVQNRVVELSGSPRNGQVMSPSRAMFEQLIPQAHARGLEVMLMISLYPDPAVQGYYWSAMGPVTPNDTAFWDAWFAAYRPLVVERAAIARDQGAEHFAFHSQQGAVAPTRYWQQLVDAIRATGYRGSISYFGGSIVNSGNTEFGHREYFLGRAEVVSFMRLFDFVGVQLNDGVRKASQDEVLAPAQPRTRIRAGVRSILDGLSYAPVPLWLLLATPSVHGAVVSEEYIEPCVLDGCGSVAPQRQLDLAQQADMYQAACEVIDATPVGSGRVMGLLSWGYHFRDDFSYIVQPNDSDYSKAGSIRGKPAEAVARHWFNRWTN